MQYRHYKKMLIEHSIFSSREFKIDGNNLQILELSSKQNSKNTIPLSLISSNPARSYYPDSLLFASALVSALAGSGYFWLSLTHQRLSLALIALSFMTFCLITIVTAFKHKSTKYTFYYANTTTRLFSLKDSHSSNSFVKKFIEELSQHINISQKNSLGLNEGSQLSKHLDYLYNFGVLDDVLYKRIEKNIHEKSHGTESKQIADNIIYLPLKKA